VGERLPRAARIVDAEHGGAGRSEVRELRIVAVDDERDVAKRRDRVAPAPGKKLELAVPVELVAEEVPEADSARMDARASSASPAASSVEATPETRFAPARLCASRRRGRRISAAIAAVVVLPFVAETTAVPPGRRAAKRSIAPGSSFESSFPGTVVPPPAPTRRDSPPTARAAAISADRGTLRAISEP
jgi:biotin carboxyl carrier protein